jgi:tricorn protease
MVNFRLFHALFTSGGLLPGFQAQIPMPQGYYRYPTLYRDIVVFVSEDDLWTVSADGGVARRLTSNLGEVSRPSLSPDRKLLAFVVRGEWPREC